MKPGTGSRARTGPAFRYLTARTRVQLELAGTEQKILSEVE